jgi:hypothetical protein
MTKLEILYEEAKNRLKGLRQQQCEINIHIDESIAWLHTLERAFEDEKKDKKP